MTGARNFVARHADRLFALLAVALATATWWPTRRLPYHWDGATFVVEVSRDLIATHFSPFVAGHSDYAHSPVFSAVLALAWRAFGDARLVSHAFILPFFVAAILGTYALGKQVQRRALGAGAAVLFALAPIVQEELGQIYLDLPLAALVSWALAAWMARRSWVAILLLCAATAVKAPAISTAAALFVTALARPEDRRAARTYAVLGAPLAVLFAWLAYHRAVTGWLLIRPGADDTPVEGVADVLGNAWFVGRSVFATQGRLPLVACGSVCLAVAFSKRLTDARFERLVPLAASVLFGYAFFVLSGLFGLRYGTFFLPALLVLALAPIRQILVRDVPFLLVCAAFAALFVFDWRPARPRTSTYEVRPDEDLGYLDMIDIGLRAARYVVTRYPGAQVFGSFPESYQLTEPFQGYVDEPVRFAECRRFFDTSPAHGAPRLVYVHAYSPGQVACRRLVDAVGATALRRFESHDKWVEIWLVPERVD